MPGAASLVVLVMGDGAVEKHAGRVEHGEADGVARVSLSDDCGAALRGVLTARRAVADVMNDAADARVYGATSRWLGRRAWCQFDGGLRCWALIGGAGPAAMDGDDDGGVGAVGRRDSEREVERLRDGIRPSRAGRSSRSGRARLA